MFLAKRERVISASVPKIGLMLRTLEWVLNFLVFHRQISIVLQGCIYDNHAAMEQMTQEEAYIFCNNIDSRARLMEIHYEEEMQYLKAITDREGAYAFWLGGTDLGFEGLWIWENSREPVGDFVWADGQPDDGITHNCMAWGTGDVAFDNPCTYKYYPLCQIPI